MFNLNLLKNKQMNNTQIDQALIELMNSAIILIGKRTKEYDSSSDSDNDSGSNCESNDDIPDLISDSDNESISSSDSDSDYDDHEVHKKNDMYKCTCNQFIKHINIPVLKTNGCKHIKKNRNEINKTLFANKYLIRKQNDMYTCSCKHFEYRINKSVLKENGCKHIIQVHM